MAGLASGCRGSGSSAGAAGPRGAVGTDQPGPEARRTRPSRVRPQKARPQAGPGGRRTRRFWENARKRRYLRFGGQSPPHPGTSSQLGQKILSVAQRVPRYPKPGRASSPAEAEGTDQFGGARPSGLATLMGRDRPSGRARLHGRDRLCRSRLRGRDGSAGPLTVMMNPGEGRARVHLGDGPGLVPHPGPTLYPRPGPHVHICIILYIYYIYFI